MLPIKKAIFHESLGIQEFKCTHVKKNAIKLPMVPDATNILLIKLWWFLYLSTKNVPAVVCSPPNDNPCNPLKKIKKYVHIIPSYS